MSTTPSQPESTLLLFDIPWSTYEGVLHALPEQYFRHTYDGGTLEIFSRIVHNVSWQSYEEILTAFGDRHFRHTYIDGELEIMSPSEEHEWLKEFIGRLIEMAAFELNVPIKSVGSTTRRHPKLLRGLEPDLSYYVQHEPEVRGRASRDPQQTPPPDLIVEVEITHKQLDRLAVYATLGVPEIWRYRDATVEFHLLTDDGEYARADRSAAFPLLMSTELTKVIAQLDSDDENTVLRRFVDWLRQQPQ